MKHGRRPTRRDWQRLRCRLAHLDELTAAHPELADVRLPASVVFGGRYAFLLALADRWEARARAFGVWVEAPSAGV